MRSYPRGWPYCRLINSASDSVSTHIHTVTRKEDFTIGYEFLTI